MKQRRTNKHGATHPCTRVHIAAHHTPEQSAMDKKIIPLSFLECFLLHPLTRSAPTHPIPHPPPPTLRKHWLFSPNCDSPGPCRPDLPRLPLNKPSPILYHTRKPVLGVRRFGPITGVPEQPGVIWTRVSSGLKEQLEQKAPFIC